MKVNETKETIIKSALKYLIKKQIEEGSVGFAVDNDHDHDCCWDDVLTWIEAQSCENAVSRDVLTEYINTKLTSNEEWASDATNEGRWVEEKTYLYGVEILEDLDEYVKTMPPVTPTSEDIKEAYLKGYDYGVKDWFRSKTQPCEDCISRQAVLNIFDEWFATCNIADKRESPKAKINALPSVKPKYTDEEIDKAQAVEQAYVEKMGKWIEIEIDAGEFIYKCTKCGMRVINPYKYCPNCGAEMSGGREDEDNN